MPQHVGVGFVCVLMLMFLFGADETTAMELTNEGSSDFCFGREDHDDDSAQGHYEYLQAQQHVDAAVDRIAQGTTVRLSKHQDSSFYVGMVVKTSTDQFLYNCGGTLVGPTFVLTAAHCLYDDTSTVALPMVTSTHWGVTVGLICRQEDNCGVPMEMIPAKKYYLHPQYRYAPGVGLLHDLALVELEKSTALAHIRMAIPDGVLSEQELSSMQKNETANNRQEWLLTAVGLGRLVQNRIANQLRTIELSWLDPSFCEGWWLREAGAFESSVVCSYASDFQGGVCPGDSGGPLVWRKKRSQEDEERHDDESQDVVIVAGVGSFVQSGACCQKQRHLPDVWGGVAAGRDVFWGPIICGNDDQQDDPTRQRQPFWCSYLDKVSLSPPPPPTPQSDISVPFMSLRDEVDGVFVSPGRYRYFVGIRIVALVWGWEYVACNGVVVHSNWVLTAATCLRSNTEGASLDFRARRVDVGYQCLTEGSCCQSQGVRRSISEMVPHPSYRGNNGKGVGGPNVALIRLATSVPAEYVKSIPRLDDGSTLKKLLAKRKKAKRLARVIGHGKVPPTTRSEESPRRNLQQVTTFLTESSECRKAVRRYFLKSYRKRPSLQPEVSFACVSRQGKSGNCLSSFGRSGTPLLVEGRNETKRDTVVGIGNYQLNTTCNETSPPELYQEINAVRDWIVCVICVGTSKGESSICSDEEIPPATYCEENYDIRPEMYDEELENEKEDDRTEYPEGCWTHSPKKERTESHFLYNPSTHQTKKCKKVRSMKSLFCRENQLSREACPHTCGACP